MTRAAIEREMARAGADARATHEAADAGPLADSLRRTGRLALLGMGASHAVGRMVEPSYRDQGIDAVALPLSEQMAGGLDLAGRTVVVASQSGESAEVVRWLRDARAGEVFGMTLHADSTLGRAVPSLVGQGGPEMAFAGTRSLSLTLALHLAVLARLGLDPSPALAALDLPQPDVAPAVAALAGARAVVVSGRRLRGVAEAAALGLCELARVPAFALEGGQMRHGPLEMLEPDVGVILVRGDEPDAALVGHMARSAGEAGSPVVVLDASGGPSEPGATTVALPRASGMAAVVLTLHAAQRLMLGFAAGRVADVGVPRRSSKVMREE